MAGNSFGYLFRLTSFGESHGEAIGGVVDGCPSGIHIDIKFIQSELARRKPAQSTIVSKRNETDKVEFISGLFNGKTTGAPIAFIVKNTDKKSEDYDFLKDIYRPGHADFTYEQKYGAYDYRGGGRASARETVSRVVAGAIAKTILKQQGVKIYAYTSQIGSVVLDKPYYELNLSKIEKSMVRCPEQKASNEMVALLKKIEKEGDSVGGVINGVIQNVPVGLGEPVFDKLHADLAKAMLSISGVKGFEIGMGFKSASMKGSEHNDRFCLKKGDVCLLSNFSGGVLGGITTGEDIYFRVAFKPISSISKIQSTSNKKGKMVNLQVKGRHDACIVPRAVPIVEAMASLVICDHYLRNKTNV